MKKHLLVFLFAACLFAFQSKAQYNYASIWVGYPLGYQLSSGFATKVTPGFFWLGYQPSVQNISTTWYINKNFSIMGVGASSVSVSYKVYDSPTCNGPLNQVLNGYGVSAVETQGGNNLRYALAGVYDKACYFTTLDNSGNVLTAVSYPFPYTPTGLFPDPSQPAIVESDIAGQYYICGSFESKMYILKVDAAGTLLWSSYYSMGLNIQPKDILVDPYNTGNVVVVGETTTLLLDKQGFFMRLNGSTGNVITTKTFGDLAIQEGFKTIIAASGTGSSNPGGFLLGGQIQVLNTPEQPWILRLDQQGNIIYSRQLSKSVGVSASVVDITERFNTSGNYEYYVLLNSDAGLHVLKLDNTGQPFSVSAAAPHNEFVYDLPTSSPSKATSISYIDGAVSTSDVGIQVFGTSAHWPGFSSSYVVSAYFNGETNCYPTLTNMQGFVAGPVSVSNNIVLRSGSFNPCTNFQVTAFTIGASVNYPCYGFIPSGSNQRSIHSDAESQPNSNENFAAYPNPTQDKTTISYAAPDNASVTISLYNFLGQLVYQKHPETKLAGTYEEAIDFRSLNLEEGIYTAVTDINGSARKQKIVFTH